MVGSYLVSGLKSYQIKFVETVWQVKVLAAQPNDLYSVPKTYLVERGSQFPQWSPGLTQAPGHRFPSPRGDLKRKKSSGC